MDLVALALTSGTIFVVELPDKTFLATLVLATKYRPLLVREGRSHQQDSGEYAESAKDVTGLGAVLASFLVLFAAEWGDLSQLLTISLVARYDAPGSVFVGALGALLLVSGLAVLAGRALLRYVSLHALHYVGAGVCLVLAALTLVELEG